MRGALLPSPEDARVMLARYTSSLNPLLKKKNLSSSRRSQQRSREQASNKKEMRLSVHRALYVTEIDAYT